MDRKGKRGLLRSKRSDGRKKHRPFNKYQRKSNETCIDTSKKKLKTSGDLKYSVNNLIGYRILNFFTVFTSISNGVKCKICNSDVKFEEDSCRGLGFKLVIKCKSCSPTYINSCPLINNAYEINRRFVFAMRLIGIGLVGAEKFCAFMDLPRPIYQSFYDNIVMNIRNICKSVAEVSMQRSAREEKRLTDESKGCENAGLMVSGDGSWKKRGFSSLYGIGTLIGYYTNKVVDIVIKSSFCQACKQQEKKMETEDFKSWQQHHAEKCTVNHEGSSGKMEVDAIREMFLRSEKLYNVRYTTYIGDGDSKTYKAICDSNPYGGQEIVKKECINHVKKRMGARLRNLKKTNKGLGGRGKLTDKLIDELCNYYGKAIRENADSVNNMRKAIWATLFHKSSSDNSPNHQNCPEGESSWCTWQRAKAKGQLESYKHKTPLPDHVMSALTPIYEELSRNELLERCLGGYTQNNNESFNALVWKIAPKIYSSQMHIVEIAAYISVCIFNDGLESLLQIVQLLGVNIGPTLSNFCKEIDNKRIEGTSALLLKISDDPVDDVPVASTSRGTRQTTQEDQFYGPGIDE